MDKVLVDVPNAKSRLPVHVTREESKLGVIVLQEWWGVNEQILERVEWFGKQGFKALVPDLYRGDVATDSEHAHHLMSGLDWEGALADIQAAAAYLKEQGCEKVFVTGYCMGGALTLAAAVKCEGLTAASDFYGVPDSKWIDASQVKIPIQMHFGTADSMADFSDSKTQDRTEEALKKGGVKYEFYRYEGAEHAFSNTKRPEVYNAEYCQQALDRTVEFFKAQ